MNNKATVNTIGHGTVSYEQSIKKKYERETMLKIGLRNGYYDSNTVYHKKIEKRLSPERFSTNYKTREEFEDDREKILDCLSRMEYAPEDLVNKVAETVTELNLRFGE